MANNPILFNAALAGASGGVTQRWITSQNPADYVKIRAQCLIFAGAVDNAIPTDAGYTDSDGSLLQSICQQILAGRWPQSMTLASAQPIALAIKAMFETVRAGLEPVSGGGVEPLSAVRYVDLAYAGGASDGSIANPYVTIQEAFDSLPIGGGSILIVPGVYPAETVTADSGDDKPFSLCALSIEGAGPCDLSAIAIESNQLVGLFNIATLQSINPSSGLGSAILIQGGQLNSGAYGSINATDCVLQSTFTFENTGTFVNTHIGNNLTLNSNSDFEFRGCTFGGSVVLTGQVGSRAIFDGESYAEFLENGGTLVDMDVIIREAAVALNHVAYVDANASGLVQNGSILNPYHSIQEAVDVAATGTTLYLAPSDYSAENVTIVGKVISLCGMMPQDGTSIANAVGAGITGPASITTDSLLSISNVPFIPEITSTADLQIFDTAVQLVNMNTAFSILFAQSSGGAKGAQCFVTNFNGPDCGIAACGYQFGNGTTFIMGSCNMVDCSLNPASIDGPRFTSGGTCGSFSGCEFGPVMTLTGVATSKILLDAETYSYAKRLLTVFTSLIVRVIEGLATTRLSVTVPAIAVAGTLDYATVSTAGTELDGITANDVVVANPTADLSAAGAGRGAYLNCRVSAANTIRLAFHGILAGGASDFIFTRVNPQAVI